MLACRSSPSMGCSAIEHRLAVVAREAVQEKHSVAVKPQSSRGVRVLYEVCCCAVYARMCFLCCFTDNKLLLSGFEQCEKAKKVLSTVPMYTLEIDNVAPDVDARIPVRRTQLEESCKVRLLVVCCVQRGHGKEKGWEGGVGNDETRQHQLMCRVVLFRVSHVPRVRWGTHSGSTTLD